MIATHSEQSPAIDGVPVLFIALATWVVFAIIVPLQLKFNKESENRMKQLDKRIRRVGIDSAMTKDDPNTELTVLFKKAIKEDGISASELREELAEILDAYRRKGQEQNIAYLTDAMKSLSDEKQTLEKSHWKVN